MELMTSNLEFSPLKRVCVLRLVKGHGWGGPGGRADFERGGGGLWPPPSHLFLTFEPLSSSQHSCAPPHPAFADSPVHPPMAGLWGPD